MTGTVLLFVALATICNGAVIPISTTWPSSVCTRAYGGTTSTGLSCIPKPCNPLQPDNEYNFLFNLLYPELRFSSLDEATLNLAGACSCGGRCDVNEYFRGGCPELKTCGQTFEYEPFRSNIDCRGLYCNSGCECYPCECYPSECYPKCVTDCLGYCKCGYCRKNPRCCYRCNKLTGQCFPGQNGCV